LAATIPQRQSNAGGNGSAAKRQRALAALGATAAVFAAFAAGVLVGRSLEAPSAGQEATAPADAPATDSNNQAGGGGPEIEMIRPDGSPAPSGTTTSATAPESQQPEPPSRNAASATQARTETDTRAAADMTDADETAKEPSQTRRQTDQDRNARPYTVQVAAFRDRPSAERLSLSLEAKGYDAYVQRSEISGKGIWYRVRVGAYAEKSKAQNHAEAIKRQIDRSAYVTLR